MTAAEPYDALSPFALKQEKDDCSGDENVPADDNDDDDEHGHEEDGESDSDDDENDDDDDEDAESVSSLAQPSILVKDHYDADEKFLRLTSMVRRVYFSYLHKSVVSNYSVGRRGGETTITKCELKEFAARLELCAVKASLEASLYRQTMLKMISDIKNSTLSDRVYKKLAAFLRTPNSKANDRVRSNDSKDAARVQSACVTSNFYENSAEGMGKEQREKKLEDGMRRVSTGELRVSSESETMSNRVPRDTEAITKREVAPSSPLSSPDEHEGREKLRDAAAVIPDCRTERDIFENDETAAPRPVPRNEDDASQDSLMQHLEDMFCESDDSSDLMTLIEKHSGVSKATVDSEIEKMCPAECAASSSATTETNFAAKGTKATNDAGATTSNKRKLSFSNYKNKMKKRAMDEAETTPRQETPEERQNRKIRGIWFVERVHQVSKLEAKMLELSMKNYRKHGRVCAKFVVLFGDPGEDESMPESPIRIEEHLTACKERIAPWVVKQLMPYYTSKVIKNRLLFKAVAKHIADMLIIENTFPEEECVGAYVKDYFRNKSSIKAETDIYV